MSIRIDDTQLITGAVVVGDPGLGVLGSSVPSTGDAGAGYAYAYLTGADASKEVRGLITTWPVSGTLTAYEDTSFIFEAPDGEYTFAWQLYLDGVASGDPHTETLIIGETSGPSVLPVVTATAAAVSATEVSATATTTKSGGTISAQLTTSATAPDAAGIIADPDDTATVTDAGEYSLSATGLTYNTQYYWHIVHADGESLESSVITVPVRTLDLSITLDFPDTAPCSLLGYQVWSKLTVTDEEIAALWEAE